MPKPIRYPILCFLLASFVLIQSQQCTQEERGLARLLGGPRPASYFIEAVWGGDKPYFLPASKHNSTKLWWSLNLTEYYLKEKDGKPWVYEEGKFMC